MTNPLKVANIPLFTLFYYLKYRSIQCLAVTTHIKKWDVIGGAAILVVLSVLLITMPESLLKSEDTPYVYDNAGWYEQFIDENGAIIGEK